jgi:phosphate/sulfate permease
MEISTILLFILGTFFAANMGVSGFSVAFTPSFGNRLLTHRKAVLCYTVCVMIGAACLGPRVAETLIKKIASAPPTMESGIIILFSGGITMFLANWLRVPQSTSFVTVACFTGAALYRGNVNWGTVSKVFVVAAIFSIFSFLLAYFIQRWVYPPRRSNLRLYETIAVNRTMIHKFIIGHDLYAGLSIGTNNVANVVAAMAGLGLATSTGVFVVFSIVFGLGALMAGDRVIKVVARDIVPVGDFSASLVSVLTATFVIAASFMGLPAPYVQFTTFAVLGISCVKDGFRGTMGKKAVQRILWVWGAVPLAACALTYYLHVFFIKGKGL